MSNKRALTPKQKKEVLLRLYKAWTSGDNRYLRLGQLLQNVFGERMAIDDECTSMDIFSIEDYDLIEGVEQWTQNESKKKSN